MRRVARALGYSIRGLRAASRHEVAFRQELILAIFLVPLGLWLGRDAVERSLLVGTVLLVLIVELLNSAIESAVDRIGKSRHELSGRSKDMGSAAVLVALLVATTTWGLLIGERLIR